MILFSGCLGLFIFWFSIKIMKSLFRTKVVDDQNPIHKELVNFEPVNREKKNRKEKPKKRSNWLKWQKIQVTN